MSTDTTAKRRISHYIPLAHRRSEDAARFVDSAVAKLEPWITAALAGEKRWPMVTHFSLPLDNSGRAMTTRVRTMTADDIRCALARALYMATEWDGFLIGYELHCKNWPVDGELVQLLHHWSCGIKAREIEAWRERKAKKEGKAK